MKKVVVVGGGFSGLISAYYLAREGFAVELHEAGPKLGGLIGTEVTPFGVAESAANGFLLTDELLEILQDLKIEPLFPRSEYGKKRFIFRQGLKRWPLRFFETLGLVFKALPKFLLAKKSFRPRPQETVWQWGQRNLTEAATRYLLAPGLQGIYAGDAQRMSAEMILGHMFQGPKKRFRGTVSFRGGMGEFIQTLSARLKHLGVDIRLNSTYELNSLTVPHVVAVSAAAAPKVIGTVAPEASKLLAGTEILPVLSATVFYEKVTHKIEGFGALFPADQGYQVLGVLSPTYIFENRGPSYSETWIYGGTHSPQMLAKTDQELLSVILQERATILGGEAQISGAKIYRWTQALPHYTLEHQTRLRNLQLPKNLFLAGNYLGVIGLSKILSRAQEQAREMKRNL